MGAGSGDLYALADEYLSALQVALADTPAGAPGRVYVSPGVPPWDCELLAVHVGGPMMADTLPLQPSLSPGHRITTQGFVNLILLTATIIRCSPIMDDNGNFPTVAALEGAAEQINADLWASWQHVRAGKRNGTLFAPKERELFFDPATSLPIQGGFGGWQIPIRVQLDGYTVGGS